MSRISAATSGWQTRQRSATVSPLQGVAWQAPHLPPVSAWELTPPCTRPLARALSAPRAKEAAALQQQEGADDGQGEESRHDAPGRQAAQPSFHRALVPMEISSPSSPHEGRIVQSPGDVDQCRGKERHAQGDVHRVPGGQGAPGRDQRRDLALQCPAPGEQPCQLAGLAAGRGAPVALVALRLQAIVPVHVVKLPQNGQATASKAGSNLQESFTSSSNSPSRISP